MIKSSDYITQTSTGSTNFFKCSAVNTTAGTWSGYKLVANQRNGFEFENSVSSVGEYDALPVVDRIYDTTGKLELKSFYRGDSVDPYGDGLLYSIFINGGGAWSDPLEGIETTDNYTSNVETVDGVTARKFTGNSGQRKITTTPGNPRATYSWSIWARGDDGLATGGTSGVMRIKYPGSATKLWFLKPNGITLAVFDITSGWHHYIGTCDSTQYKLYIDNELKATTDSITAFSGSGTGFCFGQESISSTEGLYWFNGYLANFRYYDHVLTSAEITALYEELTPTTTNS